MSSDGFAPEVEQYYETEDKIRLLLDTVVDGPSANAAAPRLMELAGEFRSRIRPYWLWLAQATNDQTNKMLERRVQQLRSSGLDSKPPNPDREIEIARQPANESFKAALAAVYQAQVDQAPRRHAESAQKLLDKLNQ